MIGRTLNTCQAFRGTGASVAKAVPTRRTAARIVVASLYPSASIGRSGLLPRPAKPWCAAIQFGVPAIALARLAEAAAIPALIEVDAPKRIQEYRSPIGRSIAHAKGDRHLLLLYITQVQLRGTNERAQGCTSRKDFIR